MATYTTTSTYFCDTDAEFRALIVIFLASLTGCGWTQTADTGQVNTATVTYPAGNSQDATSGSWLGYMDDSLHATTPIYMKVTFGRGGAAGSFRVVFSFSLTGTNGTGTLLNGSGLGTLNVSGSPSTRLVSDATLYNVFASGGTGRWGAVWWPDTSSAPYGTYFMVERFKNSDGTPNGNGFSFQTSRFKGETTSVFVTGLHWRKGATYAPSFETVNSGAPILGFFRSAGSHFGKSVRAQADPYSTLHNGKVYAFPFYPVVPGEKYPLTQILICSIHDFPQDFTNVTLTLYGASMTFKPMGVHANDTAGLDGSTSPLGMLLRYE